MLPDHICPAHRRRAVQQILSRGTRLRQFRDHLATTELLVQCGPQMPVPNAFPATAISAQIRIA